MQLESAFLKVFSDILFTVDAGKNAVLIQLDLTADFDTVYHKVLIWRLEHLIEISGTALWWFSSYLKDMSFSVVFD